MECICTRIWCVRPVSRLHLSSVHPSKLFQHVIESARRFAACSDRHFGALNRVSSHRGVDPSVRGNSAQNERQIVAVDRVFLQLPHQVGLGFQRFCNYQ